MVGDLVRAGHMQEIVFRTHGKSQRNAFIAWVTVLEGVLHQWQQEHRGHRDVVHSIIDIQHNVHRLAEAHGLQIGHSMVVIQWQKNEAGELVREVVWPADVATKAPIFPIAVP